MIIQIDQTKPVALILDHPEHAIPATAEIIGPWLLDGQDVGQLLRFAGEHFERHLRYDEIRALQDGDSAQPDIEVQLSRRGSLYYYGRREYGVTAVTDQPIPRERALEIFNNNQADSPDGGRVHAIGVVNFGGQACSWRWAVGYGVGE